MYSGYGVIFDSAFSWSIDNDTAGKVIIFGVDNIHHLMLTNTRIVFQFYEKDQLLILMETFVHQKKV